MLNCYLQTKEERSCFGCSACANACPTGAIKMQVNEKGFLYPLLDENKCVKCEKCTKVCPWHIETCGQKINVLYAVKHKAEKVVHESQSGGVFTLISDYILENEGIVYGAAFNKDLSVSHKRAVSKEERDLMRESKYVQSVISRELISQIREDCQNGRFILFTGTPCQVYMVSKNFGHYENMYLLDFICHGVPSPKVWKDYLKYRETKWGPFVRAKFRNQADRQRGNYTESLFDLEGAEHISNMYAGIFYSHLAHRECCYTCPFANEIRYSDLTMGGFLDRNFIKLKDKEGVSMLFLNSEKGRYLFSKVKKNAYIKKCCIQYYHNQPCLYHPIKREETTDEFWHNYQEMSLNKLLKKYVTNEIIERYHLKF